MAPARRLTDRHPFEIYLLVWAFATSAPGALGITTPPPSVAAQLPGWTARAWVIGLAVGCGIALVGLAWKRPPWPMLSVTGLLFEQVGLVVVGCSTIFYVYCALRFTGLAALIPAGIVFAFGLACFAQSFRIWKILGKSRASS